jgi:hypothetical protein
MKLWTLNGAGALLLLAVAGCLHAGGPRPDAMTGFDVVFADVNGKRCPSDVAAIGNTRDCGKQCIGVSKGRIGKAIVQVRGTEPAVTLPLKAGSAQVQPTPAGKNWMFDLTKANAGDQIQFSIEVEPGCGFDPIIIVDP